ncbi:MAG: hypothetical protein R3C10_18265 [Pirellulales bacterium]
MSTVNWTDQDVAKLARVSELLDTISYAQFRCLSFNDLLERISSTIEHPDSMDYVGRLSEFNLDSASIDQLVTMMRELATRSEKCSSDVRARVDRVVLRLVKLLPSSEAQHFVEPFVKHPRKSRRSWAYRGLRNAKISSSMARTLVEAFYRSGDQEALTLIARQADAVLSVDANTLLVNLDEEYWRARVIEVLLTHDRRTAIALSDGYPYEFAHAVGRTEDKTLLQSVCKLFDANREDAEFLSIYAYARKTKCFPTA